jgi:Polysaccharide pyruvyl transferase
MRKLYLDLKFTSTVPEAYRLKPEELSGASGVNLGNFAFRHALRFLVDDLYGYEPVRWPDFNRIASSEKVDRVVVSCANWLGLTPQDEAANLNRANAIEKVDCPVTAFGIGVQAKLKAELPKLGPNTLRLAKALAERSAQLSVRDQLTQDTLAAEGITNTVVTGCPSNFINSDPDLGARVAERARVQSVRAKTWGDVRSCISEASGGHSHSGAVIRQQLELLDASPAFYLIQSPALLAFVLGDRAAIPNEYKANNPWKDQSGRLTQVLKSKVLHFSQMDGWMDFARTCDVSFGMRIHGTMVPLQSGVPSALIAHDSRTIGLAERMGIPWVSPEEYLDITAEGPGPLLAHIHQRMLGYDAGRRKLAQTMHDFIVSNGLVPHGSLLRLLA